jgi:hypothetical protein
VQETLGDRGGHGQRARSGRLDQLEQRGEEEADQQVDGSRAEEGVPSRRHPVEDGRCRDGDRERVERELAGEREEPRPRRRFLAHAEERRHQQCRGEPADPSPRCHHVDRCEQHQCSQHQPRRLTEDQPRVRVHDEGQNAGEGQQLEATPQERLTKTPGVSFEVRNHFTTCHLQ